MRQIMKSMEKEKQIDGILNSLHGMQRAEPSPFFAERLSARIQHGKFESRFASESGGFWRWGVAVVISSLILLNMLWFAKTTKAEKNAESQMAQSGPEADININQQILYRY
jgi:hypothetical protein